MLIATAERASTVAFFTPIELSSLLFHLADLPPSIGRHILLLPLHYVCLTLLPGICPIYFLQSSLKYIPLLQVAFYRWPPLSSHNLPCPQSTNRSTSRTHARLPFRTTRALPPNLVLILPLRPLVQLPLTPDHPVGATATDPTRSFPPSATKRPG